MKRVFVKIFILDEVRVCEDYHLDEVRVVSMQQEDHVYVSKQQVLLYIHTHIHTYILTHLHTYTHNQWSPTGSFADC